MLDDKLGFQQHMILIAKSYEGGNCCGIWLLLVLTVIAPLLHHGLANVPLQM